MDEVWEIYIKPTAATPSGEYFHSLRSGLEKVLTIENGVLAINIDRMVITFSNIADGEDWNSRPYLSANAIFRGHKIG